MLYYKKTGKQDLLKAVNSWKELEIDTHADTKFSF